MLRVKPKKTTESAVAVKAGSVQDMDVVDVLETPKLQFYSGRYCQCFFRIAHVCETIWNLESLENHAMF